MFSLGLVVLLLFVVVVFLLLEGWCCELFIDMLNWFVFNL